MPVFTPIPTPYEGYMVRYEDFHAEHRQWPEWLEEASADSRVEVEADHISVKSGEQWHRATAGQYILCRPDESLLVATKEELAMFYTVR